MQTIQLAEKKMVAPGVQIQVTDSRIYHDDGSLNQLILGTPGSAGYDLTAWPEEPVTLKPGAKSVMIPLGIRLFIQYTTLAGMVYPRSGLGHKKGLVLGNTVGVIDSDYQGDMFVSAYNRGEEDIVVNPGDRIAQLVFTQVCHPPFTLVREFEAETVRGTGGFGSTGVAS